MEDRDPLAEWEDDGRGGGGVRLDTECGIFSIAQTPFSEAGEILWDDFEVECDWIVRTGAHGFFHPVTAT